MRRSICVLGGLLMAASLSPANEAAVKPKLCEFSSNGEPVEPVITGPQNIVPLVHVVAQPDSPVEVTSIDFEGSYLYVGNERFTWEPRCKLRVRNRSDQTVDAIAISLNLGDAYGGVGDGLLRSPASLAPGQETEFMGCGGKGHGGAHGNKVRLLVKISWVDLANCRYYPSMHVPKDLVPQADY